MFICLFICIIRVYRLRGSHSGLCVWGGGGGYLPVCFGVKQHPSSSSGSTPAAGFLLSSIIRGAVWCGNTFLGSNFDAYVSCPAST